MNAKEMFNELGYIQTNKDNGVIIYKKNTKYSVLQIKFYTETECFIKDDKLGLGKLITIDEFKAIIKQIEELGW